MPGTRDTEDLIREHPEYENIIRNFYNLYAYPERMALKEASTLHHIPIKRLNYLKQKAHRRFFLRPSVVFKILKELNSPLRIRIFLRWLRMHFI